MPFKFRRSSTDPEWLHFFYGGPSFGKIQGISLGWDLGALLLKLSELDESRPCPPYEAQKGSSFIKLEPRPHFLLTVGHCIRAIATFDHLLERWGYRETAFEFGAGTDVDKFQGSFALGHGQAPVEIAAS